MSPNASKPVLRLLTRPGCELCEAFREALEEAFPGHYEVIEADVDSRPEWRERHGLHIPVLLAADGTVLCRTHFDPDALASPR